MTRKLLLVLLLITALLIAACDENADDASGGSDKTYSENETLRIVSGSENRTLEPIIQRFAQDNDVLIEMEYLGSLDIRLLLEQQGTNMVYDAVWPANSLWLTLGDTNNITKHDQSILRSPVVLGVKKSKAEELGWVDTDVYVEDILNAAENGDLRWMMTSATQSNSGSSAYFGYLYAFAGSPEVLTMDDLQSEELGDKIKRILGTINRSSRSSGWLKDLFIDEYDYYHGMVNYEALIIEANQELAQQGRTDLLYAIYPVDGLAIADSPLAFVDKGNDAKEDLFLKLQEYLLSDDIQQDLLSRGRRVGKVGLSMADADPGIFNPDWGIDVERTIVPIRFPSAEVINEALNLYQVAFRKPSLTVYCLDYSGSMGTNGGYEQLVSAMEVLLNQNKARDYLLQGTPDDITIVIAFNAGIVREWRVDGNDTEELNELFLEVRSLEPDGGTNIYDPVRVGLNRIAEVGTRGYFPAVILMTDGRSTTGEYRTVETAYQNVELDVPIFGIMFGDAEDAQVEELTELTAGDVYDGRTDLISAFRKAKGNN